MAETLKETIIAPQSKEELQFQKLMQFANLAKYIRKDLNESQQKTYTFNKTFKKEDVTKWLANPMKYEKQLRNLSRFLYDSSTHYKRLIQYFSTMATFDHIIEPYGITDFTSVDVNVFRKKYINICNYLEIMNLKHEFSKVMERAWIDDIAYFYELRMKDSYFLFPLDPDYCQISGLEDGCLTFSFDFKYFETYKTELNKFPPEFTTKYNLYKKDTKGMRWQEIDSSQSLCIKINETVEYPVPPFCGIFEEIYALEDYKDIQMSKTELENYLLLVAKIPYQKENGTENNFQLSLDKAIEYFNLMSDSLPDQIGSILSPFEDVSPINLKKSEKDIDSVSLAEQSLYNSAGVSQMLFNSTGVGANLSKSISVDENVVFKVLRQFERWINKKLKDENKVVKFRVTFLDITKFNQADYIASLKDGATLGVPSKLKYSAALGNSPSASLHMEFLENTVLNLTDNWKPLASSFTQSDQNGRPSTSEDNLSPEGQKARNLDTNNPDSRA